MVADDFRFRAPLVEANGTKETFFAGSDSKTHLVEAVRVVRQWSDGADVSTVYELDVKTSAGAATMVMHEWHTVACGKSGRRVTRTRETGFPIPLRAARRRPRS